MTGVYHGQVLSLYRQILRLSKSWKAMSGKADDTALEKAYIKTEAQKLFRKNKYETSQKKIKDHIKEAETRLGLAKHYGIPYPRMQVAGLEFNSHIEKVSDELPPSRAATKRPKKVKERSTNV